MWVKASTLVSPAARPAGVPLCRQLPTGRLIELGGNRATARFSTAASILREIQHQGETAAWIEFQDGTLYPPDLHDSGVDLDGLVIVRVPRSGGGPALFKAAELLLRSGGFGLVILDFTEQAPPRKIAWQGRLLGLARQHHSLVVFITDATSESMSSLVSIRIEPRRMSGDRGNGGAAAPFAVQARICKDKTQALGDLPNEPRTGPPGLQALDLR